jgi:hypothetical protein
MRYFVRTTTFAAAFMAIGCTTAETPTDPLLPGSVLLNQGVQVNTTGGGMAELPAGFSALQFQFTASANGSGAGGRFHMEWTSASGHVNFDGDVTCVTKDEANGRAWIGGVVTRNQSTHPSFLTAIHEVGDDIWFRVVDYGEGSGSQPDRVTVVGFEGAAGFITSAAYCAGQPWTAGDVNTWPVVNGNIQVH